MSSTGALSSLGIGSGVLTSSVIDQLKANDTALIITPIDNKITTNTNKQQSMSLLGSLATSLTGSVSSLESSSLYQKRTVSGSNSAVSVTADTGVAVQNFSISNTKLATTNVSQSGSFTSSTNIIASGTGQFNLNVNGTDYKIAYDGTTTYDDLKTKINDIAGADVSASILQTGDTSYSLILNSKNTGKAQQISLTDLSGKVNSTLKSDNLKSDAFSTSTDIIAASTPAGTTNTLTLNAAGFNSTFSYNNTTSLSDLAKMINNDPIAGANVSASVIKNDLGTYNLVLTAKGPAENHPISLTDQSGGTLDSRLLGSPIGTATATSGNMSNIQAASDASFKYNGITLTRSTNTISDITVGVTINLLSTDSTSTANISITQDAQPIKDAMQSLVDSYNSMSKQLNTMTLTDTTTGKVGLFNGDSSVNGIDRDIKRILTSSNSSGLSLTQFGININRDGTLSFDSVAFDTKMAASPDTMASYFSGKTTIDTNGNATTTDGVFNTLYTNLNNLTKSSGVLANLTTGLTTEATLLQNNKTTATNSLNARYNTMTQQFIAYDAIISNLNNQFSSLSQQISMAVNGK
jgi:flagellar hook-associated protein 2